MKSLSKIRLHNYALVADKYAVTQIQIERPHTLHAIPTDNADASGLRFSLAEISHGLCMENWQAMTIVVVFTTCCYSYLC